MLLVTAKVNIAPSGGGAVPPLGGVRQQRPRGAEEPSARCLARQGRVIKDRDTLRALQSGNGEVNYGTPHPNLGFMC